MEQDNKKTMEASLCRTLRELVDIVNAKGIQKDDIVQVVSNNGNYALLYYK